MTLRIPAGKLRIDCGGRAGICAGIAWLLFSIQLLAAGLQTSSVESASAGFVPQTATPTPVEVATEALNPASLVPVTTTLSDITNPPVPAPSLSQAVVSRSASNSVPPNVFPFFAETNGLPRSAMSSEEWLVHLTQQFELARYLRTTRQPHDAELMLIKLLDRDSPELVQQSALLELAATAQDENELTRAQQIYAQFLNKWPDDLRVPEILLRQGLLFRQMGLNNLAFAKFYGVMTSALVLKNDQLDYYVRLVLQAQSEIAETQYQLGRYADAAEFFSRLLKQNNPAINKSQIIYKLVRCYTALSQYADATAEAQEFLARYPGAPEQPEIRFDLALALKALGRNNESLQQVLLLLQEQHTLAQDHPYVWAYWQQRAGILIANQLYHEGDYTKALEIYLNLVQIDPSPQWQLPVRYQIGMTYERLWQPQKAIETYAAILTREAELGTNASPGLKTVFDMTRWRTNFILWQDQAEAANRQFHVAAPADASITANLPSAPASIP